MSGEACLHASKCHQCFSIGFSAPTHVLGDWVMVYSHSPCLLWAGRCRQVLQWLQPVALNVLHSRWQGMSAVCLSAVTQTYDLLDSRACSVTLWHLLTTQSASAHTQRQHLHTQYVAQHPIMFPVKPHDSQLGISEPASVAVTLTQLDTGMTTQQPEGLAPQSNSHFCRNAHNAPPLTYLGCTRCCCRSSHFKAYFPSKTAKCLTDGAAILRGKHAHTCSYHHQPTNSHCCCISQPDGLFNPPKVHTHLETSRTNSFLESNPNQPGALLNPAWLGPGCCAQAVASPRRHCTHIHVAINWRPPANCWQHPSTSQTCKQLLSNNHINTWCFPAQTAMH